MSNEKYASNGCKIENVYLEPILLKENGAEYKYKMQHPGEHFITRLKNNKQIKEGSMAVRM